MEFSKIGEIIQFVLHSNREEFEELSIHLPSRKIGGMIPMHVLL